MTATSIQQIFPIICYLIGCANSFSPPIVASTRRGGNWLLSSSSSSSNDWMESLRARQLELDQQQEDLEEKWRNAKCESTIPLSFPDWVRRLDVGDYPLVAVGSSSGNVYCANLETGESIAQSFGQEEEKPLTGHEELMRIMFAGYDGGGTLAIAMHKSLICSASRQGGIQLWRLDGQDTAELISQGTLQALQGVLVTCLELDGEYLWVGTADGRLQAYAHQSPDLPLALQTTPELEWNVGSAILSLSLNQEMNHGVISTAKGTVELFSLEDDGEIVAQWMPPLDSNERMSSNAYILSSTLIPYKEDGGYAIACGCNNGCIYLQPLNYENGIFGDDDKVLKTLRESEGQLNPRHLAAVKCLACPAPGVLLSGGQDGSLRVWNISEDDSHFLYQFVGYKVWLGTLWTDGARVVSDGADNSIIVHDFSAQQ